MQEHSLFPTPSQTFIVCRLFDDGHSDWCEVIPHCSFDLHFWIISNVSIFSCVPWPSVCLFWRNVYLGLLFIFWLDFLFLYWAISQHSRNEDHGIQSCHFKANILGNNGNSDRLYFLGLQNHCRWWRQPQNKNTCASWKKNYDQPWKHIKKQTLLFKKIVRLVKAMVFLVV